MRPTASLARADRCLASPEDTIRRLEAFADLTYLALSDPEIPALLEEACERLCEVLEVELSAVLQLLPDGRLRLRVGTGWKEGLVGTATVPAGSGSQVGFALETPAPVNVDDFAQERRFAPDKLLAEAGAVSGVAVSIHHRGEPCGVLAAHSCFRRRFTEGETGLLQNVAMLIEAAMERKGRRGADGPQPDTVHDQVEDSDGRFDFLMEAMTVIRACGPDQAEVLRATARLALRSIADWCCVDLLEPGGGPHGTIKRLVVARDARAAEEVGVAQDLRFRDIPHDPNEPHGTPKVLRTGKPELIREVTEQRLREMARDKEQLRTLKKIHAASYMCVPLQVGPRLIGGICFISSDPTRRYGPEDLELAEALARCAALVVENSLEGQTEKQKDAPPLTDRLAEVLSLLDRGLSAKQIKNELNLSETTVRYHIGELRRVLGASSIPEALHKARKVGLLPR
jgi:GAF domain-containing protein